MVGILDNFSEHEKRIQSSKGVRMQSGKSRIPQSRGSSVRKQVSFKHMNYD